MNHKYQTILEYMDRIPPVLCRLLARKTFRGNHVPLTTAELTERSKLDKKTILRIGRLHSWANVEVRVADAFRNACNVTPASERKQVWYLRSTRLQATPFSHLQKLHPHERRMLQRTLQKK